MIVATRWTNGEIYERSDELEEAYAFLSDALRSARLAVDIEQAGKRAVRSK